jgi:hypothetical protein
MCHKDIQGIQLILQRVGLVSKRFLGGMRVERGGGRRRELLRREGHGLCGHFCCKYGSLSREPVGLGLLLTKLLSELEFASL